MFQLTKDECLRSQIATLNEGRGQHLKYMPYVFTENGVAMLSSVLRSDTAIEVNIRIMRAFTSMRHFQDHGDRDIGSLFRFDVPVPMPSQSPPTPCPLWIVPPWTKHRCSQSPVGWLLFFLCARMVSSPPMEGQFAPLASR